MSDISHISDNDSENISEQFLEPVIHHMENNGLNRPPIAQACQVINKGDKGYFQSNIFDPIMKAYKLNWIGKLSASIFHLWVIGDVLTDIHFILRLISNGDGWYIFLSILILYISLRFTLVFTITFEQDFLGLDNEKWRIRKHIFRVWAMFRKVGFNYQINLVESLPAALLLLLIPGAWIFRIVQQIIGKIKYNLSIKFMLLLQGMLLILFLELIVIPLLVLFLAPFVLVRHVMKGIYGAWETTNIPFYNNSFEIQTIIFYATIASLLETVTESIPGCLLQTWIYWHGNSLILPSTYYLAIFFGLVNILKSLITSIMMREELEYTMHRLIYNITDEGEFRDLCLRGEKVSMWMARVSNISRANNSNISNSDYSMGPETPHNNIILL